MQPREKKVDHDAAERYEAGRTLTRKYIKEFMLPSEAWQWAVWFRFNGEQCGTPCIRGLEMFGNWKTVLNARFL